MKFEELIAKYTPVRESLHSIQLLSGFKDYALIDVLDSIHLLAGFKDYIMSGIALMVQKDSGRPVPLEFSRFPQIDVRDHVEGYLVEFILVSEFGQDCAILLLTPEEALKIAAADARSLEEAIIEDGVLLEDFPIGRKEPSPEWETFTIDDVISKVVHRIGFAGQKIDQIPDALRRIGKHEKAKIVEEENRLAKSKRRNYK